jgi:hypothetical protein
MQRWADGGVVREERAKWEFLTEFLKKGVRTVPINTLMPLYRTNGDVFLCIRPAAQPSVMYPMYRYMHGDMVAFGDFYDVKVSHVIAAVRAVVDCCVMLQLFGGIHHCDIKPENILFRVRGIKNRA